MSHAPDQNKCKTQHSSILAITLLGKFVNGKMFARDNSINSSFESRVDITFVYFLRQSGSAQNAKTSQTWTFHLSCQTIWPQQNFRFSSLQKMPQKRVFFHHSHEFWDWIYAKADEGCVIWSVALGCNLSLANMEMGARLLQNWLADQKVKSQVSNISLGNNCISWDKWMVKSCSNVSHFNWFQNANWSWSTVLIKFVMQPLWCQREM